MPGIGIAVTEHIVFLAVVNNVKTGSRFARAFGPVSCCIRQGEGYLAILVQRDPGGQIGSGSRFTGSVGSLLFSGRLGDRHSALHIFPVHFIHIQGQGFAQDLAGDMAAVPLPFDHGVNSGIQRPDLDIQGVHHGDIALGSAADNPHPGGILCIFRSDIIQRIVQVYNVFPICISCFDLSDIRLIRGHHFRIAAVVAGVRCAAGRLRCSRIRGSYSHFITGAFTEKISAGEVTPVSSGTTHGAVMSACFSSAGLSITSLNKGRGFLLCAHRCNGFIRQCVAVRVKPGPAIGIIQVIHIPLQVFREFSQIQFQIGSAVAVGICIFLRIVFDDERNGAVQRSVSVQVKTDFCFLNGQVLSVDVFHILLRQESGQCLLEFGVEGIIGIQGVFKSHRHIGFVQGGDGRISHTGPCSVRKLYFLSVDGHGRAVTAVRVPVNADCADFNLVIIKIGMIGGSRKHGSMGTASAAARGDPVIHAAGQVAQQDVVFDEPGCRFLVHKAGGSVTGIDGFAGLIGVAVLLAAVAAGNIDITFRGIGGRRCGIAAVAVTCRAGVQDDRSGCCGIDLPVGTGNRCFIINDQRTFNSVCCAFSCQVRRSVSVCINTGHISPGDADGNTFFIFDHRFRDRGNNGQRPGIRTGIVGPFLIHMLKVQCIFDGFLFGN